MRGRIPEPRRRTCNQQLSSAQNHSRITLPSPCCRRASQRKSTRKGSTRNGSNPPQKLWKCWAEPAPIYVSRTMGSGNRRRCTGTLWNHPAIATRCRISCRRRNRRLAEHSQVLSKPNTRLDFYSRELHARRSLPFLARHRKSASLHESHRIRDFTRRRALALGCDWSNGSTNPLGRRDYDRAPEPVHRVALTPRL